jgi:hypothetical protein
MSANLVRWALSLCIMNSELGPNFTRFRLRSLVLGPRTQLNTTFWNFLIPPSPPLSQYFDFAFDWKVRDLFSELFLPWIRTSKRVFQKFCQIYTRKSSENALRTFGSKAKMKNWRGERKFPTYLMLIVDVKWGPHDKAASIISMYACIT